MGAADSVTQPRTRRVLLIGLRLFLLGFSGSASRSFLYASDQLSLSKPYPGHQKSQKSADIVVAGLKPTMKAWHSNGDPLQTKGRRFVCSPMSAASFF